jgi:uncharacterized repeat protein (TIGR01451 family)
MKNFSITTFRAASVIATLPLFTQIPVIGNIFQPGTAIAQNSQKPSVQLRLEVAKKVVLQVDGKEKISWQSLQDKGVVQPGDVLRYTVAGINNGKTAVKNLNINQPVPKGMIYVLNSASVEGNKGVKIIYSIDGGRSFVENPTVKVSLPNGKVETRPAPASAYTHIRWKIDSEFPANAVVKGIYQVAVK